MIPILKDALGSAGRFCFSKPATLLHMARHAAGLRWAIPLDALRWAVEQIPGGGVVPEDITIEARPPAIALGATADAMGTKVRARLTLRFDDVVVGADEIRLAINLSDVDAKVLDNPDSPLVALLESGAIDLSKPASLLAFMPAKPSFIVDAKGSDITIDLMKIGGIAENVALQKALRTLTPVLNLKAIGTDKDMLIVAFVAKPRGLPELIANLRS